MDKKKISKSIFMVQAAINLIENLNTRLKDIGMPRKDNLDIDSSICIDPKLVSSLPNDKLVEALLASLNKSFECRMVGSREFKRIQEFNKLLAMNMKDKNFSLYHRKILKANLFDFAMEALGIDQTSLELSDHTLKKLCFFLYGLNLGLECCLESHDTSEHCHTSFYKGIFQLSGSESV